MSKKILIKEDALKGAIDAMSAVGVNMRLNAPHLSGKSWGDLDIAKAALIEALEQPAATIPDASQDWAGMSGIDAFLLIQRHADGWADVNKMMGEWLAVNTPPAAAHMTEFEEAVAAVDNTLHYAIDHWQDKASEQAAMLRECRAALDSLIEKKPALAMLLCGSTTLGNLKASLHDFKEKNT